ncbi:hypothetical protein, partial [Burkholderia pseudomallei]|uniref:hypothetical protein n=1 Tax=Burkholderia pseudomallei TaxID=28450 RepID=UPI003AF44EF7
RALEMRGKRLDRRMIVDIGHLERRTSVDERSKGFKAPEGAGAGSERKGRTQDRTAVRCTAGNDGRAKCRNTTNPARLSGYQ